jgi:hypothetical protein
MTGSLDDVRRELEGAPVWCRDSAERQREMMALIEALRRRLGLPAACTYDAIYAAVDVALQDLRE